ncbi:MAG: hypothetical protein FJ267_19355 [Planctomycetes bacterium]|nr:hypothetical protein [Planctomycetota bacterium]
MPVFVSFSDHTAANAQRETVRKVGASPRSGSGVLKETQHKVLPLTFPDRQIIELVDFKRLPKIELPVDLKGIVHGMIERLP